MATKKLTFLDHIVFELERVATDHRLTYFVDDRHSTRYGGRPEQKGYVVSGTSIRSTWIAAQYATDMSRIYFALTSPGEYPLTPGEYPITLVPGDDEAVTEFLDAWEQRLLKRAASNDDRPEESGDQA